METCAQCGAALFTVQERSRCDDCPKNGVMVPGGTDYLYVYDTPPGAVRTQCLDDWECRLGSNFNAGCRILTCAVCGYVGFAPHLNEEGGA